MHVSDTVVNLTLKIQLRKTFRRQQYGFKDNRQAVGLIFAVKLMLEK
jgi:hypothetical protein